ncbi:DUF2490 domain-containing protein [Flavobacterium sp.]|uniref:DUF2490 domain-containing protein n=1 Tax=Flavobacterium sp. TaxID=239 RepID=UPI002FD8BE88
MRKILVLFSFLFVSIFGLQAQSLEQNQNVWFSYIGQFKVSQKWGFQLETQFRFDNQLDQNLQNVYRIGGIYFLSPTQNLILGYSLVSTFNAGLDDFYKENRLWEQYQCNKKWHENKHSISHRIRLEQRWVEKIGSIDGNVVSLGNTYQNRLRYLNRNLFHLTNLNTEQSELYAILQNEIFITLGNNKINSNVFDQNRFLVGLGLNLNQTRFEVGYMNQFVNSNVKNDVMNHTVSFSIIQNLDLLKQ